MENGDCPHLLFYGPPGSGKKTLIVALLKEIYGNGAERVRIDDISMQRVADMPLISPIGLELEKYGLAVSLLNRLHFQVKVETKPWKIQVRHSCPKRVGFLPNAIKTSLGEI